MRTSDGVFVGSIDDPGKRVRLLPHATNVTYAAGRLLFVRNGDLCAQRCDPERLAVSGPVSILVRDVRFDRRYSLGVFSATAWVLALQHGAGQDANELIWLDRTGRRIEQLGGAAVHDGVNLSPDGTQVLVSMFDRTTSRSALARFPDTGGRWQLAEDSAVYSRWTRGGREIVYLAFDTAHATVLPVDLSGRAPRFGAPQRLFPVPTLSINGNTFDVSPDGERILFVLPVPDARPTPYSLILKWERCWSRSHDRNPPRTLRDLRSARRGRYGRRLQRPRHAPRAKGCDQAAAPYPFGRRA